MILQSGADLAQAIMESLWSKRYLINSGPMDPEGKTHLNSEYKESFQQEVIKAIQETIYASQGPSETECVAKCPVRLPQDKSVGHKGIIQPRGPSIIDGRETSNDAGGDRMGTNRSFVPCS